MDPGSTDGVQREKGMEVVGRVRRNADAQDRRELREELNVPQPVSRVPSPCKWDHDWRGGVSCTASLSRLDHCPAPGQCPAGEAGDRVSSTAELRASLWLRQLLRAPSCAGKRARQPLAGVPALMRWPVWLRLPESSGWISAGISGGGSKLPCCPVCWRLSSGGGWGWL